MWRARRNTRASRVLCKMVLLLHLALQFACSSSIMDFIFIGELFLPLDTVLCFDNIQLLEADLAWSRYP
jgi:hypothetical protein